MAFRAIQAAIVIDTLIADLVQEVIERCLSTKEPNPFKLGPCQRLFDILGIIPYGQQDDDILAVDDVELDKMMALKEIDAPPAIHPPCGNKTNEKIQKWHSWLVQALAADSSEDELEIYHKSRQTIKQFSNSACQTEQLRIRKRNPCVKTPGDRALRGTAPCELERQTIFIDAMSVPTPSLHSRPPLADRFCYMLTDFASALYCSLAIMCCCTPSMFR
ncbi:uncharacterized protein LOC115758771 isoform X1 [Drosophila novamexicana]|uniref:uncharacterized protein LOC115758771 isoform X1 n=1 Tax=Drosophila novamexicana TaxID=47314 RepID=UPI0011E5B60C|nr:uncharacterized protein LOC115758771 isoform X1 [Drosophila novamexicana]